MDDRYILYNTLLSEAYWQVNKSLARQLGIETAIILSDLISKEKYFNDRRQLNEGWFFNQQSQIENDTTLSPHKQRKAIDTLKEAGLIDTKLKGIPPLQYYKINHSNILMFLTFVDKEIKEHNKNKDNNTTINSSIVVSKETTNSKKSLSNKNEIKISDKSIEKYKVLIERWNSIDSAISHDTNKKTKTLKKIITLFQQLEAGTFFRYTGLDKKWCIENNVPVEWMSKKFTVSEISKGIRHMAKQFKPGYWPYTPEQKKKLLPKSLAESLFNPYGGCASVFLKALANPPKEVEPLPENKYPQIVDRYCEDFLGNVFEQLPISSQRNIIKAVNAIVDWQKRQAGILCPIFSSTSFSTYFGTKDKPNNFISTHINFLKNKGGIYSNKEPYHKSFKPSVSMIAPEGGRWQRFISDFSSVHGFDINPDEDKIRKLKIMYNN